MECRPNLDQVMKTGRGKPDEVWSYLVENPNASQIFNEAMKAKASLQVASTVEAYDFSQFGLIGDIGGGL